MTMDRAIHEDVRLVAYDSAWPHEFTTERERLHARFPVLQTVVHIGSTAIPAMPAKPIIDILAGVESMAVADRLFEPILAYGYTTSRDFNATLVDRRWFMRSEHGRRTHHLHVVALGGKRWIDFLRFRDALRADAGLAERYANLKFRLGKQFQHDREGYTNAKTQFVASVIDVG